MGWQGAVVDNRDVSEAKGGRKASFLAHCKKHPLKRALASARKPNRLRSRLIEKRIRDEAKGGRKASFLAHCKDAS